MPNDVAMRRQALMDRFFPEGTPSLWCPLLTHYKPDGGLDRARMEAHLAHLAPRVKGCLIPGSTGDGWEMDEGEIRQVLHCALGAARQLGLRVLIGVLRTETEAMLAGIRDTLAWLRERTGASDPVEALDAAGACGFTVCPPKGEALGQEAIEGALRRVLDLGVPVALYQLPQVTGNEMAPETVAALAREYPNFVLFKDTSGKDRVALSGLDLHGVFRVRGAEGEYARWLKGGGGPYDGLLLSTTNTFSAELAEVIRLVDAGREAEARALSERVSAAVAALFALAADLPFDNPFANANKAADHFFAHGPGALSVPPPRAHAGPSLPAEVICRTAAILERHDLMPSRGYLD